MRGIPFLSLGRNRFRFGIPWLLGKEVCSRVFNRVGAALSKYISPISSSKTDLKVDQEDGSGEEKRFERFHARKEAGKSRQDQSGDSPGGSSKDSGERAQQRPQLRVIKADQASQGLVSDPLAEVSPAGPTERTPPTPGLSVSHAFLNLMRSIQQGRLIFAQWLGRGEYRKVQRNQRKGATIRKGAMLDQKAE